MDMPLFDSLNALMTGLNSGAEKAINKLGHIDFSDPTHLSFITIIFVFSLSIEILLSILTALMDDGITAFTRGVQALLWAAIIFSVINTGLANQIFISFGNEATSALGGSSNMLKILSYVYGTAISKLLDGFFTLGHVSQGSTTLTTTGTSIGSALFDISPGWLIKAAAALP